MIVKTWSVLINDPTKNVHLNFRKIDIPSLQSEALIRKPDTTAEGVLSISIGAVDHEVKRL